MITSPLSLEHWYNLQILSGLKRIKDRFSEMLSEKGGDALSYWENKNNWHLLNLFCYLKSGHIHEIRVPALVFLSSNEKAILSIIEVIEGNTIRIYPAKGEPIDLTSDKFQTGGTPIILLDEYDSSSENETENLMLRLKELQPFRQNPFVNTGVSEQENLFRAKGAAIFNDVFNEPQITILQSIAKKSFEVALTTNNTSTVQTVGENRWMYWPKFEILSGYPEIYGHPILLNFVRTLLGTDCILNSIIAVTAKQNAGFQKIHADHQSLFDKQFDRTSPPFALAIGIPLTPLNFENGSTRLFLESHISTQEDFLKIDGFIPVLESGAVLCYDYRLLHQGLPTANTEERTILYLIYSKPWFRETTKYREQMKISMSHSTASQVPEEFSHLFTQAEVL